MTVKQELLGTMSELMVSSTSKDTKNVFWTAVETQGPLDLDAVTLAASRILAEFPNLTSTVAVVRQGIRWRLMRQHHPGVSVPILVADLPEPSPGQSSFDRAIAYLSPRLDREWNLNDEPPAELHVLRLEEDRHILALAVHHVVGDVAMAFASLRDILGQYHAITKGDTPEWLGSPYVLSSSSKKQTAETGNIWQDDVSGAKRERSFRKKTPVRPSGSGTRKDRGENYAKRELSEDETDRIISFVTQHGFRMVDHLLAGANISLDQWNDDRNVAPGTVTSAVTVNMRQRFGGASARNFTSIIFFRTKPSDRDSYLELARFMAAKREASLRGQWDRRLHRSLSRGAAFLSFFPLWVKRKVASVVMARGTYSLNLGYLGVIWPRVVDGEIVDGSCLVKAGDLDIVETLGAGHKLAGRAHLNLIGYIFRRKLNLILFTEATVLNTRENASLLDLIAHNVRKPRM
jgi:Condensation domain